MQEKNAVHLSRLKNKIKLNKRKFMKKKRLNIKHRHFKKMCKIALFFSELTAGLLKTPVCR